VALYSKVSMVAAKLKPSPTEVCAKTPGIVKWKWREKSQYMGDKEDSKPYTCGGKLSKEVNLGLIGQVNLGTEENLGKKGIPNKTEIHFGEHSSKTVFKGKLRYSKVN
jgi:hypothetical protein